MKVYDATGLLLPDGAGIPQIYQLRRCYFGSPTLIQDSASLRQSLVGTALVETASSSFPRCALLLADHVDVLCDFLQYTDAEEPAAPERIIAESESPDATNLSKRNAETPASTDSE